MPPDDYFFRVHFKRIDQLRRFLYKNSASNDPHLFEPKEKGRILPLWNKQKGIRISAEAGKDHSIHSQQRTDHSKRCEKSNKDPIAHGITPKKSMRQKYGLFSFYYISIKKDSGCRIFLKTKKTFT